MTGARPPTLSAAAAAALAPTSTVESSDAAARADGAYGDDEDDEDEELVLTYVANAWHIRDLFADDGGESALIYTPQVLRLRNVSALLASRQRASRAERSRKCDTGATALRLGSLLGNVA